MKFYISSSNNVQYDYHISVVILESSFRDSKKLAFRNLNDDFNAFESSIQLFMIDWKYLKIWIIQKRRWFIKKLVLDWRNASIKSKTDIGEKNLRFLLEA